MMFRAILVFVALFSSLSYSISDRNEKRIVRSDDFKPMGLILEMQDRAHEKVIKENCADTRQIKRPSNFQSFNVFQRFEDENGDLKYYQAPLVTGNIICEYRKIVKIYHWAATAKMNEYGEIVPGDVEVRYYNISRKIRRW